MLPSGGALYHLRYALSISAKTFTILRPTHVGYILFELLMKQHILLYYYTIILLLAEHVNKHS